MPYYFSYEDLVEDWRQFTDHKEKIRELPPAVSQISSSSPSASDGTSFSFIESLFSRLSKKLKLNKDASENAIPAHVCRNAFVFQFLRSR